jgi:tetratricopeptide (TPR) repeat protein
MKKKHLLIYALLFLSFNAAAQKTAVHEGYEAFKQYRNANADKPKVMSRMLTLLADSNQLSLKQLTNVQYHIGRLYEEMEKPDLAIPFYEKTLKAEPDYEVVHRALGFIYLARTKVFVDDMNLANKNKDAVGNAKAYNGYKKVIQKAIPYLEKYQACSPDEETLAIIGNLYKSIKDTQGMLSLADRLKKLSLKCVTLLDDE